MATITERHADESTVNLHDSASVELLAKVTAAVESAWTDYEGIALRLQFGAEIRTKVGQTLRPSSHWIDGTKTRKKMTGTACFYISRLEDIAPVLDAMCACGYAPRNGFGRLVVIGSNDGTDCDGESMPEPHARALRNAVLLAKV